MTLNLVTLVGRAGSDPEMKYFESGSVKCSFSLAVNRNTKKDEQPDWFTLEMWSRTAEVAGEYVRKGSLIGITGALSMQRWNDRTSGEARERPVIKVERLELLGSRREGGGGDDSSMPSPDMDDF
jgi:single-strand DNA-binding protein